MRWARMKGTASQRKSSPHPCLHPALSSIITPCLPSPSFPLRPSPHSPYISGTPDRARPLPSRSAQHRRRSGGRRRRRPRVRHAYVCWSRQRRRRHRTRDLLLRGLHVLHPVGRRGVAGSRVASDSAQESAGAGSGDRAQPAGVPCEERYWGVVISMPRAAPICVCVGRGWWLLTG